MSGVERDARRARADERSERVTPERRLSWHPEGGGRKSSPFLVAVGLVGPPLRTIARVMPTAIPDTRDCLTASAERRMPTLPSDSRDGTVSVLTAPHDGPSRIAKDVRNRLFSHPETARRIAVHRVERHFRIRNNDAFLRLFEDLTCVFRMDTVIHPLTACAVSASCIKSPQTDGDPRSRAAPRGANQWDEHVGKYPRSSLVRYRTIPQVYGTRTNSK